MAERFTHGYALLIGVNESQTPRWALPEVAKDINALKAVLIHPERCSYLEENVKTITGVKATRQGIIEGMLWLREKIAADQSGNATAILYYSGHGWRDEARQTPDHYLIPFDAREMQLRLTALGASDFASAVQELAPKRLLVALDCCHSGGMGAKGLPLPVGLSAAAVPIDLMMTREKAAAITVGAKGLGDLTQGSGRAVISSSQAEQISWLRQDGAMSIFTYHLIEALTGHAQPAEGATEVLATDVMSYVYRRVPESAMIEWKAEQQPDYQLSGNFPVAMLLGGKGLAKGQAAPPPTPESIWKRFLKKWGKAIFILALIIAATIGFAWYNIDDEVSLTIARDRDNYGRCRDRELFLINNSNSDALDISINFDVDYFTRRGDVTLDCGDELEELIPSTMKTLLPKKPFIPVEHLMDSQKGTLMIPRLKPGEYLHIYCVGETHLDSEGAATRTNLLEKKQDDLMNKPRVVNAFCENKKVPNKIIKYCED